MIASAERKQTVAILSRLRAAISAEVMASWLSDSNVSEPDRDAMNWVSQNKQPLLRSLHLLSYNYPAEVSKAALTIFLKADPETALAATALLDRNAIASNPEAKTRLDGLLKPVIGKADFVALVERLNLTGFEKELLDFITTNPNAPESVNAARLIAAERGRLTGSRSRNAG